MIFNLNSTIAAEMAADVWWDKLSKKEREAYKKAHPRSKYAKQAAKPANKGKVPAVKEPKLRTKAQQRQVVHEKIHQVVVPATEPHNKTLPKSVVHTGENARKASNDLVKNFGAERLRRLGSSNPYSDWQDISHRMSKSGVDAMHKHLIANGWSHKSEPQIQTYARKEKKVGTWNSYRHPDGGMIDHAYTEGKHNMSGKDSHHVTVYGKKRAKPTTIPYYD